MARLSDELDDLSRRHAGIRDALTTSTTNTYAALERIDEAVAALRSGDLSKEQKAQVDTIEAQTAEIRTAVESTDTNYEPLRQEPAPVKATKGRPAPGSAADRSTGSV